MRVVFSPDFQEQCFRLGEPFLEEAGDDVLAAMRIHLPASRDGSHGRPAGYARSRLRVLASGRDPYVPYRNVGTDATTPEGVSYPSILEHGSPPHEIRAHGDYSLRTADGRYLGRVVQHPGIKPIPWARRSAQTIHGRRYYAR